MRLFQVQSQNRDTAKQKEIVSRNADELAEFIVYHGYVHCEKPG